ncbi:MAG: DeoR/GlpR transcriptional regulator [Ruminococcaceae bacterium]|nr:DeoR/GlpR transcriptional regulator [Oscillospiraceae bacterium]
MFALERQKMILELLEKNGAVTVSNLSSILSVTEETVRRDLEKLEKQEALRRTHGGAVPIDESTYEFSLEKRKSTNVEAKEKLAEIALSHIASGDTIFLDASTTTFFIAKGLKKRNNITVITNSIRVIAELSGYPEIKTIAVGGIVSENQSFVGSLAEANIRENYVANKMFFSSKGITVDAGILESNEKECGIKQKMLKNSGTKFYLCDSSKIGRIGFVKLCAFDDIDYFISDAEVPDKLKYKLSDSDVKIINV